MFDKTQYIVEKSKLERLQALRDIYNITDVNGNLLCYVKKERLRPNYWFEGTDGTRMGEIREGDGRLPCLESRSGI